MLQQAGQHAVELDLKSYSSYIHLAGGSWPWSLHALECLCQEGFPQQEVQEKVLGMGLLSDQWQLVLGLARAATLTSACLACAKSARWRDASHVMRSMLNKRMTPGVVAFSSSISGCERAGQWSKGIHTLSFMASLGVWPNTISCNSAISACDKRSRWQQALQTMSSMWLAIHFQPRFQLSSAFFRLAFKFFLQE